MKLGPCLHGLFSSSVAFTECPLPGPALVVMEQVTDFSGLRHRTSLRCGMLNYSIIYGILTVLAACHGHTSAHPPIAGLVATSAPRVERVSIFCLRR